MAAAPCAWLSSPCWRAHELEQDSIGTGSSWTDLPAAHDDCDYERLRVGVLICAWRSYKLGLHPKFHAKRALFSFPHRGPLFLRHVDQLDQLRIDTVDMLAGLARIHQVVRK